MTVVVDLGCADHGVGFSLAALIAEYEPDRVYGFDPSPLVNECLISMNGTPVEVKRSAAWLHDGETSYTSAGTGSRVGEGNQMVSCFDFSAWLRRTVNGDQVVVKMDIEGAEYALLERMIEDGTDVLVSELLVEWHGDPGKRAPILARLSCPVREWWM